jgi:hypothetical protein
VQPAPAGMRVAVGQHRQHRPGAEQRARRDHRHPPAAKRAELAWLRDRGITLADIGQADIDQWLRTGPSAILARDFLSWASSRGYCRRLEIPVLSRTTGAAISQDQRWALAARLLNDTALDPMDRIAGCLLLLYGQPLSRIAAMTTSQVACRGHDTFLTSAATTSSCPARSPTPSSS